jgi:exocyst complex component 4
MLSGYRADDRFIGRGLSHLAEHLFIASARQIKVINPAGVSKMKRNILSVQQCLRGLSSSQNDVLARAMIYWDLYEAGPKVGDFWAALMIANARGFENAQTPVHL